MTLEEAIRSINKKTKDNGSISVGVPVVKTVKIPFSSVRLNYMTYGGLPLGRVAEFYGSDGSGKTTTAINLAGMAQKLYPDKKVLFVDVERTFDAEWATRLGLDCDNIIYYDPDSEGAETIFNNVIEFISTGEISVCIIDSLGAMVSTLAYEKSIGERTYGGIALSLTEFSKKICPILSRTDTILIGINQVRDDMNSMYGGSTTTGGKAWRHACSTRLEFRKGNYIDDNGKQLTRGCENPAGNIVNVALIKSKVCRPDRKVGSYTLKYLYGIDYIADLVDVAIQVGVINQSGAWYSIIDTETGETLQYNDEIMKLQGKASVINLLKSDTDLYEIVYNSVENELEKM